VKALPRWRRSRSNEERLRERPELHRWRGKGGGDWGNPRARLELPGGQPDPAPFILGRHSGWIIWPNVTQIIWPPRIFCPRGQIFWPGKPKTDPLEIFKNRSYFDDNLNSCAKIRCLEIGWLR
jgi:hypothetical protein